ncbi:MAG: membrane protein insertion efficiency factor YidD [Candidatus Gracilibacteria bacterium]|nr:membrane protein insertion efficiency factor YidD [Candidatus Gracilibacteria bacterium]
MKKIFTIIKSIINLPQNFVCWLIKIYQKTFSFDHGPQKHKYPFGYCRFKPTCSEYAIDSIKKYGLIYGGLKSLWRIIRCNPWSKGGWDPVGKQRANMFAQF